jgi:hypothetical protein
VVVCVVVRTSGECTLGLPVEGTPVPILWETGSRPTLVAVELALAGVVAGLVPIMSESTRADEAASSLHCSMTSEMTCGSMAGKTRTR